MSHGLSDCLPACEHQQICRTREQIQITLTSWQLSFVDLKEVHNFIWSLSQ